MGAVCLEDLGDGAADHCCFTLEIKIECLSDGIDRENNSHKYCEVKGFMVSMGYSRLYVTLWRKVS
jgi:hypothetical protein